MLCISRHSPEIQHIPVYIQKTVCAREDNNNTLHTKKHGQAVLFSVRGYGIRVAVENMKCFGSLCKKRS